MPKRPLPIRQSMFRSVVRRYSATSPLTKSLLIVTALVTGITGSIVGVATAYPIIEPWWYVSRGELRLIMDKQAIATDRQTLFQLEEYLTRAKNDPGAANSPIVQDRIRSLENQIRQTSERIRNAEKAAGGL